MNEEYTRLPGTLADFVGLVENEDGDLVQGPDGPFPYLTGARDEENE